MPRRNLFENLLALLGGQVVAKATTFVGLYFLARYLGNESFGRFAVALAIPASLEAVADLGMSWAIVREGAGRPDVLRRDVADALPLKALLALALVSVSYATALLLGLPDEAVLTTTFLAIARAFDSMTRIARAVFEAYERMEFEAISSILDSTVRLAFTLYALVSGFGLVGLAESLAVGGLVVLVASAVLVRHRFLHELPRPQPGRWGHLLLLSAPFALLAFFELIGFRIETILTSVISGDAPAGVFALAVRVVEPTVILPGLLGAAFFPVASRHAAQASMATLAALLVGSGKLSLTTAIGIALVLGGLAPVLIPAMFGESFRAASGLVQILCLAMPAVFMRLMISRSLMALRSTKLLVTLQLVGLAVLTVGGLVLIPRWSAVGAAIALALGETTVTVLGLAFLWRLRYTKLSEVLRPLVPAVPATITLLAVVGAQPILAAALSGAIFVAGLRIWRVFSVGEIDYLRQAAPWLSRVGDLLVPRGL